MFFICLICFSLVSFDCHLICLIDSYFVSTASTTFSLPQLSAYWKVVIVLATNWVQNLSKVKMVLKLLKPRRGSILTSSLTYSHSSRLIFQVEFCKSKKKLDQVHLACRTLKGPSTCDQKSFPWNRNHFTRTGNHFSGQHILILDP